MKEQVLTESSSRVSRSWAMEGKAMLQLRRKKGYLAAVIGGVSGTAILVLIGILLNSKAFVLLASIGCGQVFGCWLALRWRRYEAAARTAGFLVLLMPLGWILFYIMSLLIVWVVPAAITIIGLPLSARALATCPESPGDLQKVIGIFARMPLTW